MRPPPRKTRVLLADDHSLVAAGLRSMLEPVCEVAGLAENGRALVQMAEALNPDVILLDISMPDLNGIEAARQLRKLAPHVKLIFVTMHTDATFVAEAMRAGAAGYVAKQSAPRELVAAIEAVMQGHTYLTPLVTRNFVDDVILGPDTATPFGKLTARQREVLQLVAEGHSNKEVAARLGVTPKTVEFHKANIAKALGVTATADLVRYALRHGIVPEE